MANARKRLGRSDPRIHGSAPESVPLAAHTAPWTSTQFSPAGARAPEVVKNALTRREDAVSDNVDVGSERRGGMGTLRLLKIAGLAVLAVIALLVLSALASIVLSLLSAVVTIAVIAGLAYLAYRLYAVTSGGDDEFEVESEVEKLQREFER